tara:strand:+ start:87 stop:452 length:366 start_codon:yes stop_codon:yes gene_type:complete
MAILKKYTATFTPTSIKSKQVVEGGKVLVTEVLYRVDAYETANSSNTLTVNEQSLTFDYFSKNTSASDFIEIEDVSDSIVKEWITDYYSTRELELNAFLTYADTGFVSSVSDDVDLTKPYG